MAAGGPGDHPLTDICVYHLPVFSPKADELIRQLFRLMPRQELYDWTDWFNPPPLPEFEAQLGSSVDALHAEAIQRGWDLERL
jgi:hypothetical protein